MAQILLLRAWNIPYVNTDIRYQHESPHWSQGYTYREKLRMKIKTSKHFAKFMLQYAAYNELSDPNGKQ